jgi:hypothetical protein
MRSPAAKIDEVRSVPWAIKRNCGLLAKLSRALTKREPIKHSNFDLLIRRGLHRANLRERTRVSCDVDFRPNHMGYCQWRDCDRIRVHGREVAVEYSDMQRPRADATC